METSSAKTAGSAPAGWIGDSSEKPGCPAVSDNTCSNCSFTKLRIGSTERKFAVIFRSESGRSPPGRPYRRSRRRRESGRSLALDRRRETVRRDAADETAALPAPSRRRATIEFRSAADRCLGIRRPERDGSAWRAPRGLRVLGEQVACVIEEVVEIEQRGGPFVCRANLLAVAPSRCRDEEEALAKRRRSGSQSPRGRHHI